MIGAPLGPLVLALLASAPEPAETQLALSSLRPGEAKRLQQLGTPLPLYKADLAIDVTARKLSGTVALTWTPAAPVDEVFLRATANALHAGAITVGQATLNGRPVSFSKPDTSLYELTLAEPLPAGEPVVLTFKLGAKVPAPPRASGLRDPAHAARTDFGAFSSTPEFTSLVGLIPMLVPRRANGELRAAPSGIGDLGSFEPAHWLVSLTVPKRYSVVAPGVLLGELPDGKGTVRFAFAAAAAREFPLFVFRGYELSQAKRGDVSLEIWAPKRDQQAAARALTLAGDALERLEQKLGPYPWKRLQIVSAPLTEEAGGMEFPGLFTVSGTVLRGAQGAADLAGGVVDPALLGSLESLLSPLLGETFELTIAHEVAHQYFAMQVGSDAVDEPIVDEPLTQHVALLVLEWLKGKPAAEKLRAQQLKTAYQLHRLMGGADGKANRSTAEFANNLEYGALVYGKAPLLFDAQRALVGDDVWLATLKAYVERYRWREAGPDALPTLLAERAPKQASRLEALRQRWWDEAHGDEDLGALSLDSLLRPGGASGGLPQGLDPKLLEQLDKAARALAGE